MEWKEAAAMILANQAKTKQWTVTQAMILAAVCLVAGAAGGWEIHASQRPDIRVSSKAAMTPANAANQAGQAPGAAQLKEMADAQAAPQMDKLKSDPKNPDLLTSVGNIYYDAQQYSSAVDYYTRALAARPSDASVRTDMATAYWYMGNADTAIAEFNKALTYAPNNPNTLFNRGLVKWQGKRDGAGALADWEKLLAVDPSYEAKAKVEQMMGEVKKEAGASPAMKTK